ncbi:hypothetical protein ACVWYG_000712 [Pedobacter sp. UYEF25]
MSDITFNASFDEVAIVRITRPQGARGNCQILIDNFYCGMFIKTNEGYRPAFNDKFDFTTEDIDILINIIQSND